MNIDIWVVGTTNEIFAKGSETEARFLKNELITGKMSFFVIGSFCTPIPIALAWTSGRAALYGNAAFSILVVSAKKR